MLALLYLTLALVLAGALALRAVTQQSLYSAVWETIAGAAALRLPQTACMTDSSFRPQLDATRRRPAQLAQSRGSRILVVSQIDGSRAGVGIDWTFASLDEAAAHTLYGFAGRAVAVAVSLGGVCVTALLLGIVSEQISHWIEDLKRGRSEVGAWQTWSARGGRHSLF